MCSKTKPERIYLDHAATTPVDAKVVQAMLPYFSQVFGNASSIHAFAQRVKVALKQARWRIWRVTNRIASPRQWDITPCCLLANISRTAAF
ncbi:MAG: aminotransferase class V-fold PLP-dependent enzyme [bacterium]